MAVHSPLAHLLVSPSQIINRRSRDFLAVKVPTVDVQLEGFPKGAITEIWGPASSGRTSLLNAFLSSATQQEEYCAVVDGADTFDPESAEASGVNLNKLFWVRCGGSLEHALKCTDLLIHGGGWGVVTLDLCDLPKSMLRKLPVSYWYRFLRAIEPTSTVMVTILSEPQVKNCALLSLEMECSETKWSGRSEDHMLFHGMDVSITPKKPANSEMNVRLSIYSGL